MRLLITALVLRCIVPQVTGQPLEGSHPRLPIYREGIRSQKDVKPPLGLPLPARHLPVPLDHFSHGGESFKLKYFMNDTLFEPGGALVVVMPAENGLDDMFAGLYANYSAPWAGALKATVVILEHRFFGVTIPNNDTSVENYQYLTVEQSLADVVALIDHIRSSPKFKSISKVVAVGGSYSGALAAWIRRVYPDKVDAAIAHSPVVNAFMDFPQYGISNLVALSSPDSRCAMSVAQVMNAVARQVKTNRTGVMKQFNASFLANQPMGYFELLQGLAFAMGGDVQPGTKSHVCDQVKTLWNEPIKSDVENVMWLQAHPMFQALFFNLTKVRDDTHYVYNTIQSTYTDTRSWWWMKCTQLGWFKTAPKTGMSSIPFEDFTMEMYLDACAYMFPKAALVNQAKIDKFNARFGGMDQEKTTNVFYVDYSDDPWKMATILKPVERQNWPLNKDQPWMLLTCDNCGHCGEGNGVSIADLRSIEEQELYWLKLWLAQNQTQSSTESTEGMLVV